MASTEDRLRALADANLEVDGQPVGQLLDPAKSFSDVGVSSMDIAAFARVVAQEFEISFTVEQCAEISSFGELISFLDAQAA